MTENQSLGSRGDCAALNACMQAIMETEVGVGIVHDNKFVYYNEYLTRIFNLLPDAIPNLQDLVRLLGPVTWPQITAQLSKQNVDLLNTVITEFRSNTNSRAKVFKMCVNGAINHERHDLHFIIQDITVETEKKRKYKQQRRLNHDDRLSSLGTLTAGLAHELNQPLHTIRILIGDLRYDLENGLTIDEKHLGEKLTKVDRYAFQMSDIIRNITRFATKNHNDSAAIIDVNEAIDNVFTMLGQQFEHHRIRIEKRLSYEAMNVVAEKTRLEQIIINLTVNAYEALKECNRDNSEIWVSTEKENEQILIEVGDNATGVLESLANRVFEPYFTTKDFGKGTGLGLSITRSIVNELNGHISLHNNDQGGATFLVILPEVKEIK